MDDAFYPVFSLIRIIAVVKEEMEGICKFTFSQNSHWSDQHDRSAVLYIIIMIIDEAALKCCRRQSLFVLKKINKIKWKVPVIQCEFCLKRNDCKNVIHDIILTLEK